jgi:hypothetical protein
LAHFRAGIGSLTIYIFAPPIANRRAPAGTLSNDQPTLADPEDFVAKALHEIAPDWPRHPVGFVEDILCKHTM